MKIVINSCFGGFEVSKYFLEYYDIPYDGHYNFYFPKNIEVESLRTDNRLIEFIEKFGSKIASGKYSELKVVEIPKGTLYKINEYDGLETIKYKENDDWSIAT